MQGRVTGNIVLIISIGCLGFIVLSAKELPRYRNLYGDTESPILDNLVSFVPDLLSFLRQVDVYQQSELSDHTPIDSSVYDFVIVGAGTAGATVAARLSEIKDAQVLLLEAGHSESLIMDIPLTVNYLQLSSDLNWKYQTEPSDKYCQGMIDRRCNWPRGKVMGGSSVLNYMIATRGSSEDYDRWAEMGNAGWSYKDVLPYFKKLESIAIPELMNDSAYHSTKGPVHISNLLYHTPIAERFMEAGKELGYPTVDYNGAHMIGFSYLQTTIMNGTRVSSNRAYLKPIKGRTNLHVSMKSLVSKVLMDSTGKRAVGVEFWKNGIRKQVYARKEVILSAGTIGSAQLLMLSGIGPAAHLNQLGIEVFKDLPVGNNLMDHIAYGGMLFLVDQPVTLIVGDIFNSMNSYMNDFMARREGPLTIPGTCEAVAYIHTNNPQKRDGTPNMELLFMSGTFCSDPFVRLVFGISDELWQESYAPIEGEYAWNVFPMLLKPKSRGWIKLKANDINVKPMIVPNYMSDPNDVKVLIQGIRATLKLSKTIAMKSFTSKFRDTAFPKCKHYKYQSDAYWECALRTVTVNIFHYSGTCKMGPKNDSTAVVNPRLQVIGIKGLRVADASIMPEIPSGHTNIPVIMIAEKLADMVKQDWGYPTEPLN